MNNRYATKMKLTPDTLKLIAGRVFNSALFYLAWFVCINQATGSHPYNGPILIAFLLALHLYLSKERLLEIVFIGSVALFGTLLDSTYIHLGWVKYVGGYEHFPGIIPLWMTSLWAFYATSINHSLAWLRNSLWLMIPTGSIGAVVSYSVAFKLDAAHLLVTPAFMLTVIGCVWAFVFPLSFWYSDWLKKKFFKGQ